MKVLVIAGRSAGGVAKHLHQVCELLIGEGVQVTLAQPAENPPSCAAGVTAVPLAIGSRPGLHDRATSAGIRELARGADVLHAHGLRAGALAALALRKIAEGARPRLIVTLHNEIPRAGSARLIGNYLLAAICKTAEVVLGVSPDLVELARSRGARDVRLALIPAEKASASSRSREEVRVELQVTTPLCLLTVARLAPQKGLELLVGAARQLDPAGATWLVAGDGPLRAGLEQKAQGTCVRFLGARSDVGDLLQAADIVVSTSLWEGQSVFLQEALQAGSALVATAVGGTPEVTGEAALLVQPAADDIAQAVGALAADAEMRAELREAALRRATELPTREAMLAQLWDVYGGADEGIVSQKT